MKKEERNNLTSVSEEETKKLEEEITLEESTEKMGEDEENPEATIKSEEESSKPEEPEENSEEESKFEEDSEETEELPETDTPNRKLWMIGGIIAIIAAIAIIVTIATFSSKETETKETAVAEETTTVETEESEVVVPTEAVVEEETEVVVESIVEETISEPESYATPEEWIASLELTEIKMLVYNENGENKVISDGEAYEVREGDKLYMGYPEKSTHISIAGRGIMLVKGGNFYCAELVLQKGTDMEYEFTVEDVNGNTHTITGTLTNQFD